MAFVLDKKVVKDTKEFNDYAYGITLPVQRGSTGMFRQAFSSFEQAKANLKNLLMTSKGERILQPNFGTGLKTLLFEQADDNLAKNIEKVITSSVKFWLPYINIEEIDVRMTDEMKDANKAEVSVNFTVGNQIDVQEITFKVEG